MASQVATKKSDPKSGRKIAIGALVIKRKAAPKEDSEAAIRLEKDQLASRLKAVCPKFERAGEKQATSDQDALLAKAGELDEQIEALQRRIAPLMLEKSRILAPIFKALDESGKYAIVGSTYKVQHEAYESSITLKLAGNRHTFRKRV